MIRHATCAALAFGLAVAVAPALAVAPGKAGPIVFANGDALGRGSILQLADPEGKGIARTLTPRSLAAAMPSVSPDGTRVAFASLPRKGGGIYVLTLASGAVKRLTAVAGDVDPVWAPDGKRIVFARRLAKGGHQLSAIAPAGGAVTKIAGGLGRRPDFSPDGGRIVFQRDGAQSGIATILTAGGTAVTVAPGSSPSWSPNGLAIAYVAPVSGVSHLFLSAPDGTQQRDITRFAPVSQPSWSPDGTHIVLVTSTAAGTCCGLATVDAEGNGRVRITHGLVFASRPSWAPAPA